MSLWIRLCNHTYIHTYRWRLCEEECKAAWAAWSAGIIGGLAGALTEHCLTTLPAVALRNRDRATRALALFQGVLPRSQLPGATARCHLQPGSMWPCA